VHQVFTHYVRQLVEGATPARAEFTTVLGTIEQALLHRLRVRGFWGAAPSRVGQLGFGSWTEPGALREFVADCHYDAILRRLPILAAALATSDNIEGLVWRNVDHFLADRQRRHDRVAYSVFKNVEAVLMDRRGYKELTSATVVVAAPLSDIAIPVSPDVLRYALEEVAVWRDAATHLGVIGPHAQNAIDASIDALAQGKVVAFYGGDLVDAGTVAARHARALHSIDPDALTALEADDDGGILPVLVRSAGLDEAMMTAEVLALLQAAVPRIKRRLKVRENLRRVVDVYIEAHELDALGEVTAAEVARRVGVSPATMAEYSEILRALLRGILSDARPVGKVRT
jgi:hypothetical protein